MTTANVIDNKPNHNLITGLVLFVLLIISCISLYNEDVSNVNPQLCKQIFYQETNIDNTLQLLTNTSAKAETCGGPTYFEQYLPDLQKATAYTLNGNAIRIKDIVYSTKGMTIKKDSHWYYFLKMSVPSITITVGNKDVEIMFASKEEQDKHFNILAAAIAKS